MLLVALATALATAIPSAAQDDVASELGTSAPVARGKYNSYIVVMKADPLVVTEGRDNLDTARARNRGQQLKASHDKVLRDAGVSTDKKVSDYVNALNGFAATVTYAEAVKLAAQKEVAFVLPDQLRQPTTDSSPGFIGLTAPGGAWATGVTGKGVVVGVIDTGIWPEHPSFDGAGFPAPPVTLDDSVRPNCEFGNTAHNADDAPFTCNNKLIGARQMLDTYRALIGADPDEFDSARDDAGHGTHTASTAAGNDGVSAEILGEPVGAGPISGIAPDAHIIAYKGLGNLGGFTSDLAAAIDQAVEDGVDVINYSIGGGAALPGADEIAFLFAADAGVFVATSAGNAGPGPGTVGNPATTPWLTSVGANTQTRFFAGTVALGNGAEFEGASVTQATDGVFPLVDAADAGGDLCVPGTLDPSEVDGAIVLCRRGAIARVAKSLAVLEAGGVGMVMYENTDDDNLFSDTHFVPSVSVDNTPGLEIKAYIASEGSGATAEIKDTKALSEWPSAPSTTRFSSRGPNFYGDIIKPDITAPGMQILAGYSPFDDPGFVQGELFASIAGTSMSSPHVAGLFALLKQANPDWSAAEARSALMTTAHQDVVDNDRVSPADPFDMGSGHVRPGRANQKGSAFQPGLVYDAGLFDYFGFLCDVFPGIFANPTGTCGALEGLGIPTDASDLNYPSIAVADLAGSQTVTRTVTSVAKEGANRTYNVSVDAPPGYSVSVSPSSFRLRRGQSATYEVTITNVSAPVGEWRFGSLTWSSNAGYDVYSPIAVKGAQLDAPSELSFTGTSGSGSFDVLFGYTGDYTAGAHGLSPDTGESGTVAQDPDQTCQCDGTGGPGEVAHTFTLSNSAHLRITMDASDLTSVNPGATDIDLFLFRNGTFVAQSTAGATNEAINIANPPDGNYTLFVHGWAVVDPAPGVGYTFHLWDVPATPGGGSLVIDSAPTSATIGQVGTIEFSWSGLSAGPTYLGAVSHSDADGVIGLTLIRVETE